VSSSPQGAGLQAERTALAWQRTAITASFIMVPLIVVNARLGSWLMTAIASLATMAAAVMVVGVRGRFRQLRHEYEPVSLFEPMLRVAVLTALAAAFAVVTAVVLFLS
jgi:Domain of unknown function (DUF202)